MLNTMQDVFVACQASISVHQKLLTALKAIHAARDDDEAFFVEFVRLLRHALVRGEKSAPVERTLEFAARFARHLCPAAAEADKAVDEAEEVHPFFGRLFQFLVDSHRAADSAVRLRSCQLLNKLLLHLGENAYLDDALCDRVYEAMLERLQDTVPAVRVQAVFALSRLQEPHNKQCPVIRAYVFHLRNDPSADVRRAVLLNIGGSAATLPHVLERIRDSSAPVRRQAYLFLTKVHIKSISMSERRRLLKEGLQDRDEAVRRTVQKDLLQFWLRLLAGSVTQLLRCLYVEMCPDVAELVVKAMCRETSYADMVESLALPADTRLFAADQLTAEHALLWRALCDHLRSEGGGADSQLERITPDLPALCGLIQQLSGRPPADGEHETDRFVLRQLIALAAGLELWDEFGRRFATAQELQRQQTLCQEEERELQERPEPAPADDVGECAERDDPATLTKCLTVLYELLQSPELKTLTAELRALAETLVLPAVQNEDPGVREAAVRALGALSLLNRGLAEHHLVLFVQVAQADQCEVQLTALRAVFDQLLVHGLEVAAPAEQPDQMAPLVTELTAMLDVGEPEVRGLVAEGLCKLLMHGRISSPRLLERLVLMWYNPVWDGDSFLRNMLGVFFPAFGAASRANQEMLADAMLPTIHTLMQAPMTSPLVEVDLDDVARFFVQLTQSAMLAERQAELPGSVHEALAYRLLNALLDGPLLSGIASLGLGLTLGYPLVYLRHEQKSDCSCRDPWNYRDAGKQELPGLY
ncbi:LOW QUALITY PROTEIN: condensin complex subunit 3-like [Pollicipes pollicipes]|uniref:LOW QUALITY PROTEIN: condensin complex subunit 3-like n=1 Tax=Pollicipes pollicipes TaxID=41117 RepID=UPI001885A2EB|nr:LOW QUALITY PROTEIN: condensin complex subunit 3-like [Pollicipes pollicipes]